MPYPPIGAIPAPPSRNDPATFSARMDAFLAAYPQMRADFNALAAYLDTLALATGPGIFQQGSAALPGITFQGDTDTGFFRLGANQLGLTEGGVSLGRLYARGNLLGTVSQSAGLPTGAAMEYGSNANGEYWRLANGLQLCAHLVDLDGLNVTVATGAQWRSDNVGPYAFPAAFAGSPWHADATLHKSDNTLIRGNAVGVRLRRAQTSSQLAWDGVSVFSTVSAAGAAGEITRLSLFAIGRWF